MTTSAMRPPSPTLRRDSPELSVIIVTYACRDLVLACLASLAHHRTDVDMEVVVVDNDSPDGTLDAVRTGFPWVTACPAGGNVGFSKANNIALAQVTSRYILLLNPDTIVPPDALRACLDALKARPEVGMLGCKLVRPDGSLDHAAKRGFPTPLNALWHFLGMTRVPLKRHTFQRYTAGHIGPDQVSEVDAINGAFMLIRREALSVVGPLDESFWMYGEDLDWCLRFWRAGWKILYWPVVSVVHVKGGSSSKLRAWRTNKAFHEAMWLFYSKHYAPENPRVINGVIWLAIHVKLLTSACRTTLTRRVGGRKSASDTG